MPQMTWRTVRTKLASLWEEPLRQPRSGVHALNENVGRLRKEWITIRRFGSKAAAQKRYQQKFDAYWGDCMSTWATRAMRT